MDSSFTKNTRTLGEPPAIDDISRRSCQSLQPNLSETIDNIIADARRVALHRVHECARH